jgi:hypothetical protein
MSRDDWMGGVVAGAGFLGIGLGVALVGVVSRTSDLVLLGGVLAGAQGAFILGLVLIRRFNGLR